jgi:large subunit ribosomal protein L4
MELKVTTLEGKEAGSVELSTRFSASSRARHHPALRQLAARQAPGRHAQDEGPRRHLAHRQEDVQAEGHRRRPSRLGPRAAVPRRRPRVRPGGAQPRDRPAEEGARAGAAHALSAKAKDGGLIVIDKATLEDAKTKALIGAFSGSA